LVDIAKINEEINIHPENQLNVLFSTDFPTAYYLPKIIPGKHFYKPDE
jgi:hypothetical protein